MDKNFFRGLIFNPHGLSDQELIAQAEQGKLFEILGGNDGILGSFYQDEHFKACQVRYVLYLYDKNSPLWMTEPDIASRKKKAASLAGFDILSEKSVLEGMFLLKNVFLARSVTSFIKFQYNIELSALISNEQVLYELQHVLREELTSFKDDKQKIDHFKTKTELLTKQDAILVLCNRYKSEIWKEDQSAYEMTMEIEYGRKVTPEQIAIIDLKTPGKIMR